MIYDLLASDKKITAQMMSLKAIESAGLILRNMEFKFSEDSKENQQLCICSSYFFNNYYIIINIAMFLICRY